MRQKMEEEKVQGENKLEYFLVGCALLGAAVLLRKTTQALVRLDQSSEKKKEKKPK